jgi:hypothetical protein
MQNLSVEMHKTKNVCIFVLAAAMPTARLAVFAIKEVI